MISSSLFLFLDSFSTCLETLEKSHYSLLEFIEEDTCLLVRVPNHKDLESDGTGFVGRILRVECSWSLLNIQLHKYNVIDMIVSCDSFAMAKIGCYHKERTDSILG